ncbi:TraG/TraD/VirD4 family protein [Arthrobacter sp. Marseille-P9274]|uniref:TraG/TraD/VirD4 family protein n=1 Tax=Arthrobacter sp. Marseille-P9274 TaxID=2866572 RepID=UPI0021C7D1F2|nr:TraG/TraD/VirD4 family protein [Arthrobacter sp. Marseille-P9274]
MAIAEAMEERAERRGGPLDAPALFALDELANVVRWAGLPNQFSHYGSKGLIVMAILQSWSQGVELWGEANMRKIWSAANIREHQGLRRAVAEEGFLRALSDLIGDYSYTAQGSRRSLHQNQQPSRRRHGHASKHGRTLCNQLLGHQVGERDVSGNRTVR